MSLLIDTVKKQYRNSIRYQLKAIIMTKTRQAKIENNAEAQIQLARYYARYYKSNANYYEQAIFLYKKASLNGIDDAKYELGNLLLESGNDEGIIWLEAAAYRNHTKALYDVAIYHLYSFNDSDDNEIQIGLKSLHEASNNGDIDAQTLLGIMYMNGEYVKEDIQEATKYFLSAAMNGSESCLEQLRNLFNY